jgi:thiol-disulfide isomerase/thioredoxin
MKTLVLLMLLAFSVSNNFAQTVKFSSSTPEAGQTLSFIYDPTGSKLEKLANVKCDVYTYINNKFKLVSVPLIKEGSTYKGSFTPVDSTAIAVLSFSADGTKDENPNGYYTLFYKGGKPTAMAYYWESQFYNGMGKAYAGANVDNAKALLAFENAFNADPKIRYTYLDRYMALKYSADKVSGEKMIRNEIANLNKTPNLKEADMMKIASLYNVLRKKPAVDSVNSIIKTKYPKGVYAYGQAANAIFNEKDAAKKEEKLTALIKDFDLDLQKKADALKVSNFYLNVANAYGLAKNNAKFEEFTGKIDNKMSIASAYNTYAWAGAENKENLEFAAKISKKSLDLIEAAKNDPMPEYYNSKEEYLKGLESSYASYADTYAVLLDHMGKSAEALKFQEDAVNKNNFSSADMNVRYVSFLAKMGQKDKVITFAERFVKEGQGNDALKADLKTAYSGTVPFDTYYAGLERVAIEKERAKFMKEMIDMPAPKFTLANLKGEAVSLEKLKGKVVIVDYWATWCGPCIASFPGMQKAVEKYKNDPNVVFLFVNTWQTEENREKLVKDWAAANPTYSFNILLDTKNVKDPSKFDVIEQYKVDGIPTKFIVDGNGNIRFKKVGFSGSADVTVKELDMMIALAKGSKEASK